MRKISLLITMIFGIFAQLSATMPKTVTWTSEIEKISDNEGFLIIKANIADGYHIYGNDMPAEINGMPTNPTIITIDKAQGLELEGELTPSVPVKIHTDKNLDAEMPWWEGTVTFRQRFRLNGVEAAKITGNIKYMACDATSCTPPATEQFDLVFGDPAKIVEVVEETPATNEMQSTTTDNDELWQPHEMPEGAVDSMADMSLLSIFILGLLGGLVALLTPCVWPMIPMTVSFFLKTSKVRRKAISNAMIYGVSIIVIFLVLGLAVTAILGPQSLNDLATSAVFNIIFFLLLVVFAISFFGAFDIKLPSKWSNAIDNKAETTSGYLSIFFMAFTLVIVSFSCTGPIIGTLLVESVTGGSKLAPAIGMGAFALGLALPFTLFAIFPSFLQTMPKSGGWLNSVKVVLGFIELILSLKFLSVADLAYGWRLLDREVFVAIWIVLFVLLGMYLLGKLRFSHDSEQKHTSVLGFFMAVISFSFAVYLVPGLWGAPLKAISAFAPPLYTQDFNLYGGEYQEFSDYDEGMAYAAKEGKPVFVDFTGYGCVNCRKMEMAVFDTPEVRKILEEDFVIIRLYVDEKKSLSQPYTVEEDGKQVKISTYGEKWSYLQRHKFGNNSQPYYVLLDNAGCPLEGARVYDENVPEFVKWLENGLKNYKK